MNETTSVQIDISNYTVVHVCRLGYNQRALVTIQRKPGRTRILRQWQATSEKNFRDGQLFKISLKLKIFGDFWDIVSTQLQEIYNTVQVIWEYFITKFLHIGPLTGETNLLYRLITYKVRDFKPLFVIILIMAYETHKFKISENLNITSKLIKKGILNPEMLALWKV